jgi:hypothetical protein
MAGSYFYIGDTLRGSLRRQRVHDGAYRGTGAIHLPHAGVLGGGVTAMVASVSAFISTTSRPHECPVARLLFSFQASSDIGLQGLL